MTKILYAILFLLSCHCATAGTTELEIQVHTDLDGFVQPGQSGSVTVLVINHGPGSSPNDYLVSIWPVYPQDGTLIADRLPEIPLELSPASDPGCDIFFIANDPFNPLFFVYHLKTPSLNSNQSSPCVLDYHIDFRSGSRLLNWQVSPSNQTQDVDPILDNNLVQTVTVIAQVIPFNAPWSLVAILCGIFILSVKSLLRQSIQEASITQTARPCKTFQTRPPGGRMNKRQRLEFIERHVSS